MTRVLHWWWVVWHVLTHESPRGHVCRAMAMPANNDLPYGWPSSSYMRYQREHLTLRLTLRSLNNHELREILIGLWSRLDRADQADHIAELQHYFDKAPCTYVSGLAAKIRDA